MAGKSAPTLSDRSLMTDVHHDTLNQPAAVRAKLPRWHELFGKIMQSQDVDRRKSSSCCCFPNFLSVSTAITNTPVTESKTMKSPAFRSRGLCSSMKSGLLASTFLATRRWMGLARGREADAIERRCFKCAIQNLARTAIEESFRSFLGRFYTFRVCNEFGLCFRGLSIGFDHN